MLDDLKLPGKNFACGVRTAKLDLSDKDKEILESAVMNFDWPVQTLQKELKKRNLNVSDYSIRNHREKTCSCWKI